MDDADRAEVQVSTETARCLAAHLARVHHPRPVATDAQGARICRDCGDPLTPARLHAQPGAVRCVECQADHERGQQWP